MNEEIKDVAHEEDNAKAQSDTTEAPKKKKTKKASTEDTTLTSPANDNGEDKPKPQRKPRKKAEATAGSKTEENGEDKPKPQRKPRKKAEATAEAMTEENGEDKPKPQRKPRKKAEATDEAMTEENGEEKPKPKRKPRKKAEATAEAKPEDNGEEKPKPKRKPRKKPEAVTEENDKKEAVALRYDEEVAFEPPQIEISLIDTVVEVVDVSNEDVDKAEAPVRDPDAIVHPDDLFSTPTATLDIGMAEPLHEENVDDDGQYKIVYPELDTVSEAENEEAYIVEDDSSLPLYDPEKPRKIDGKFDFVELFVFTLLAVMLITTFFFRHAIVDGPSMENTLYNGEHLIISDLFYTPKRGDIIVCEDFSTGLKKPIVKRVIAVEGDTVRITARGEVYVNDELLDEEYVYIDPGYTNVYKPLLIEVEEGRIFVMGDHRSNSTDSRNFGTVSEESVIGRVLLRFYPFDKFGIPQ